MYGPKWPFSLRYVSRDMRRIDFPQVDGLSTDTPGLGRHTLFQNFSMLSQIQEFYSFSTKKMHSTLLEKSFQPSKRSPSKLWLKAIV